MAAARCFIEIFLLLFMMMGNTESLGDHPDVHTQRTMKTCESSTFLITYDNNPHDSRLQTSWGFSCLVRRDPTTILFDAGGDSRILLSNMDKLQIHPEDIDVVVLSHIHGDHTGGLAGLLKKNHRLTVYLPVSFPQSLKDEIKGYGASVEEVSASREIAPGVYTTGQLGDAIQEQSLTVKTHQGLVVITGCAHPGIVDIVKAVRQKHNETVYLVMGGFHLGGTAIPQIQSVIQSLQKLGVKNVAPCHCTGDGARTLFQRYYGNHYMGAGVGTSISIQEKNE